MLQWHQVSHCLLKFAALKLLCVIINHVWWGFNGWIEHQLWFCVSDEFEKQPAIMAKQNSFYCIMNKYVLDITQSKHSIYHTIIISYSYKFIWYCLLCILTYFLIILNKNDTGGLPCDNFMKKSKGAWHLTDYGFWGDMLVGGPHYISAIQCKQYKLFCAKIDY